MKGRKFINSSGKICAVKEINGNVTVFEDGTKINTNVLLDTKYFTALPQGNIQTVQQTQQPPQQNPLKMERIDPDQFFSKKSVMQNSIMEQISSMPSDFVNKIPITPEERANPRGERNDSYNSPRNEFYDVANSSNIEIPYNPDIEAEEIAKRNSHLFDNTKQQINNQASAFSRYLDEGDEQEIRQSAQAIPKNAPVHIEHAQNPNVNVNVNHIEEGRASTKEINPVMGGNAYQERYSDPMIEIFKKSKMNTDFKINIEIAKKIPKISYIEMMEENCETSIVEYLAQEFTASILANPNLIKDMIVAKIRGMMETPTHNKIFKKGDDEIKPVAKKTTAAVKAPAKKPTKRVLPVVDIKDTEEMNEGVQRNNEE